jgi:hypothetical protein
MGRSFDLLTSRSLEHYSSPLLAARLEYTENITSMRRELDGCDRDCNHFVETNFTPTRLLDLEADNGIQLIETNTKFPHKAPQYAALGYCGGSTSDTAACLVTDKLSLKSHLVGIPTESISGVLWDTIATVRSLSIRYLWIDVLCIIQGDSEVMSLVYGNAYVTVCAPASP